MSNKLKRLLNPDSIAVVGGHWAAEVVHQSRKLGFAGKIWPVHPDRESVSGHQCYHSLEELPGVPDATFIGVNKQATIDVVSQLSQLGGGGAICFASGFSESAGLDDDAEHRQNALVEAAADMPIIGPNCYGMINYLNGVALWPDQHGGKPVDSGVAIITQSSNIAINLSMQQRGLPIAYLLTAGNQAQTTIAQLSKAIITDPRVTALGLHIEGFSDIRAYEDLALEANKLGKKIVVLKTGVTSLARAALMSHTSSLSGNDAAASAFIERLAMCRVRGLGEFIETLKVLDLRKSVSGSNVFSMSCSGGEAALVSDMGLEQGLNFPSLNDKQVSDLRQVLGDYLALNNPLDYHTSIWNDVEAMQAMVSSLIQSQGLNTEWPKSANDSRKPLADIALLVLDFPRSDRCNADSWQGALNAFANAVAGWSGVPAVLASLPENMPESVAEDLRQQGIVALCGMRDGLKALKNAAWLELASEKPTSAPVWLMDTEVDQCTKLTSETQDPGDNQPQTNARLASQEAWGLVKIAVPKSHTTRQLDESTAKRLLSRYGLGVPSNVRLSFADVRSQRRLARALDKVSQSIKYPVVAKGLGIVHKSEANAIELGISSRRELEKAVQRIECVGGCMIEEQIQGSVAELLVSVIHDPVHGLLMTIGAGGVTTEVLKDVVHCLLPVSRDELDRRLQRLQCAPLLNGFRGRPKVDRDILLDSLMAVQLTAQQLGPRLLELEINPLLCCENACFAVDAFVSVRDLPNT